MKRELDIKMELEGAREQLDVHLSKSMTVRQITYSDPMPYINNLRGLIWALSWILEVKK